MSLADYVTIPDWDDAVRVAFLRLPWPGQRERILDAWLRQPEAPVRFIDVALYHIVRHYGDGELRRRWIATCIDRALDTRDGSLTESLLWILGPAIASEQRLLELALQLTDSYPPIRKPLNKFYAEPSPQNAYQSMERTATRFESTFCVARIISLRATHGVGGRRSSPSR